jgi:solute carrier family 25 S-adenosylmethionine transporter 26
VRPPARAAAESAWTRARLCDLYRGLAPSLLGVIPVSLVYMPVYELACAMVASHVGAAYQPLGRALAGSLAGLACSVVHVPTSVLKNRLQVSQYPDVRTAAVAVARAEGLAGFYRGWTSAAVLEVLSATVQFVALDRLRTAARALGAPGAPIPPLRTSLIGCAAGVITALCTEPLDVVKTRLTTQSLPATARDAKARPAPPRGVGGTLREIARTEGGAALWRGLAPRIAYNGLKGAIWYSAYEWSRAALGRR